MEAIALRLEAIAIRLKAIAIIASRVEAIARLGFPADWLWPSWPGHLGDSFKRDVDRRGVAKAPWERTKRTLLGAKSIATSNKGITTSS